MNEAMPPYSTITASDSRLELKDLHEPQATLSFQIKSMLIFIFMVLGFIINASAQSLSLAQVLDSVERNNPLLNSYEYRIDAAHRMAAGAKAWEAPRVGAGPYDTPYGLVPGETFFNRQAGSVMYFAEQDIPNPARVKAKTKYLNSLAASDSADAGISRNSFFTEAKSSYVDRLMAEKRLRVINQQIALLNFVLANDTATYPVNQSDLTSIYKTQARIYSLEAERTHQTSAIAEANATLNYLMNRSPDDPIMIDTVLPFKHYTLSDFDTSSAFITSRRSDVMKLNSAIASLQLNHAWQSTLSKPDFSVRFEHNDMFGSRNTFSLLGTVSIPIAPWASKSYKSEAASLMQQEDALNLARQNNINEARAQMRKTLLHTLAEYKEVRHYEAEVLPAFGRAFSSSMDDYSQNAGTLAATLMAWDDYYQAQTEYFYHLEQAYKSEIAYENATERK